jgi:phosphoserine phosphatase RsbU/P
MSDSVAISQASLEIVFPNRPSWTVAIDQSPFLIGRGSENGNHLTIDDSCISRKCAAIVQESGAYRLQDLGQLRGLFVNEEKVSEKLLCNGDSIRIGGEDGCKLIFRIGAAKPMIEHLSTQVLRIPVKDAAPPSEGLEKLNLLLEATLLLHSQQPLDAVLGAMLDHAISITKADRGMLLEPESSGSLKVRLAHNSRGESLPPEHMKPSRTVLGQAIESQSAVINEDVHLANLSVQSADSVVYQLLRATVVIPLYGAARGLAEMSDGVPERRQLVGAVYLDSKRTAAFSALDRQILDALAVQAASIIDNANLVERERERQRLEQELSIARQIQQALLPQGLQDYPHLVMTGVHRPCHEVGGDYFDVFPLSEDRTAILIADVSGKGLGAALLTTMLQGALSGMTLGVDPARVFHHINRFLCEHAIVGRYATMFFGMLSRDGALEFIRAGHPSPMLLRRGAVSDLYSGGSFPVGLVEEATFTTTTMQLEPGDTLLLFSDGVNEAEDRQGNLFGLARLREVLAGYEGDSLDSLQQAVLDAVESFTQGASQSDDITLLAVRYRTPVDA